jgi:chaperonin GroES
MQRRAGTPRRLDGFMKVVPLGDKVVVKRLEADSATAGGIVLPDSAQDHQQQQGRVLSVGDGQVTAAGVRSPFQVQEGDRVVFRSYAGTEVKVDGQELLILREDDILAVIE